MRTMATLGIGMLLAGVAWAGLPIPGDARLGVEVFKDQRCITCHSVNGEGGKAAPDLGKRTARSYTPAFMASLMWNHAPTMWSAMEKSGIERPQLSEDKAADLFAFFYSARYFERPGDAARGKQAFLSRRCAECHSLTSSIPGGGPPVVKWESLADPITLSFQMWNHSSLMRAAMQKKKVPWPRLTSQELTDILVYLQNLPQTKGVKGEFAPGSAETGEEFFQKKGCADCHKGAKSLENRFARRTLTDFAVAMWNHAPRLADPPPVTRPEGMRRIVGYLWSLQFFDEKGSPAAGKKVFEKKKCATCHNDPSSGAPKLAGTQRSAFTIVSALWKHGPTMLDRMKQKGIEWPRFQGAEMTNLLAYLNSMK